MDKSLFNIVYEYIWLGGKGEIRSKTKVEPSINRYVTINEIPIWNYDGSSTWQADSNSNTEVILKPCKMYKNVLRNIDNTESYLVLCETYDINGNPMSNNNRYMAKNIFNQKIEAKPWYGLEQEYFLVIDSPKLKEEGYYYCGTTSNIERKIAEEHLNACLQTGLTISGINAEVASKQWEFQIGPVEGIDASDQMIVARYLLERIAEKYNVSINYHPKPELNINGSGCHTNFSTVFTRAEHGINTIYDYIKKLENKHDEHINVYGESNNLRLTGIHETSSINKFSYGVGTRNTSIRIPNNVQSQGYGYFEDRRPASNMDPYLVTSIIFKTCCLENYS